MLKKLALLVLTMFACTCVSRAAVINPDFSKVISRQDLNRTSSIAIAVKDLNTSKVLYKKNENKMLNTASTLKLFTFASALDTLGCDYKFETAFYVYGNNLYLKLGADPLLEKNDLFELVSKLKKSVNFKTIKYIYIDDKIISSTPYPDGWCVDDFWPNFPPISPYIIDRNMVKIRLVLSIARDSINIVQQDRYRFSFINRLQITDDSTKIDIVKDYSGMKEVMGLTGTINEDTDLELPVNNPRYFFITRLEDAFGKYSIPYGDKFYFKEVPAGAKKIASVSHSIEEVSVPILKYSDNFTSEVLFRVAAHKYALKNNIKPQTNGMSTGTTKNGVLMFTDYYSKAGLDMEGIKIVDGSGVSRYNAASPGWICNALVYLNKNLDIRKYMQTADEGTLKKRLRYLKDNLYAKTGTHNGLSALCGVLKTRKGKDVVFSIVIQSYSLAQGVLKSFEDDLVDCIFSL